MTQPISRNVIVRGEAYDIGSGINRVNVQIDNGRQVSATKTNQGDWLYWTALVTSQVITTRYAQDNC